MPRIRSLAALLVMLSLCGCWTTKDQLLQRGMRYARRTFERMANNPSLSAAYDAALERGGTPASFIISTLTRTATFTDYEMDFPRGPWTVVIVMGKTTRRDFIIQAYGSDLGKPRYEERVTLLDPPKTKKK